MKRQVFQVSAALASGLVFGVGLSMSGMLNPVRVRGFLDVFGAWDPSLAFVLGGAVAVSFFGVTIMKRIKRPAFDEGFHLPETRPVDVTLIVGSALFGIGWGVGGLCPGPAVASLSMGMGETALFVAAMLAGMTIHDRLWRRTI